METKRMPDSTTASGAPTRADARPNTIDRPFERPAQAEPPAAGFLEDVRAWIEENPGLAVLGAVGLGLLAGRLIATAIPEPEPTLAEKVERRARAIAKAGVAYGAGVVNSNQFTGAADAVSGAAHTLAGYASTGYDRARDYTEIIADAVKDVVSNISAKRAQDLVDKVRG